MKPFVATGPVRQGNLPNQVRVNIGKWLKPMEGKWIEIRLAPVKAKRSTDQNAYYWGVVIPAVVGMFREAGTLIDGEEAHDYLKRHVGKLVKLVVDPAGVRHSVVRSSNELSVAEFEEYLAAVRAWGGEFGVMIPLPGEYV